MARQNLHLAARRRSAGGRWSPAPTPSRPPARSKSSGNRNLDWPRPRAAVRAQRAPAAAQLLVDPPRRGLRPRALRRPRGRRRHRPRARRLRRRAPRAGDSDPRGSIYATLANQTQVIGTGIYSSNAQGSARRPRAPPARHRAACPSSPGPPASTATPGSRWTPATPSLRQARRQELQRHLARVIHVHAAADPAGLRAGLSRRRATSTTCAPPSRRRPGHHASRWPRCVALRGAVAAESHPTSRTRRSTSTSCSAGSTGSARRSTSSIRTRRSRPSRCPRWVSRIRPSSIRTPSVTAARPTCSC